MPTTKLRINSNFVKGLTIKYVRSQGRGGGCPMLTFSGQGGSSDVDSAYFGAKTSDFSKFMVCPHGQERLSQCDIFRKRVEGCQFFADVFNGRPLTLKFSLIIIHNSIKF